MSGETGLSLTEWKSLYKDIADTAGSLKSYQTECTNMKRMIEQVESTVKTENEKLTLTAKEDAKTAEITLDTNHGLLSLEAEAKQVSKAIYSLSYLSEIVKAAKPLSDLVTLEYASDMPVKIDFLPVSNSTAKLTFYLAPRIE